MVLIVTLHTLKVYQELCKNQIRLRRIEITCQFALFSTHLQYFFFIIFFQILHILIVQKKKVTFVHDIVYAINSFESLPRKFEPEFRQPL